MRLSASVFLAIIAISVPAAAQKVEAQWDKVERISRTTATLQVVVNPPLRRGSPIHDRVFAELKALGADYVRYVPWLPYPKLGVAELEPPTKEKTSWDFSLIDPMTIDFLEATKGHSVMLNFSTIPAWMFKTPKPVEYPNDPNQVVWNYTQGTELRDPSGKEVADYYARLVGWYVNGGFTDELGKRHNSGHRYKVDYWEVLNEPDIEHNTTPKQYTERYDAIVGAIKKVAPGMKFVGISVAFPSGDPQMFEHFLNPKNHKPGIPLDMISYHFYASPTADQTPEIHQFTFFDQADRFIATARYIEAIRLRLSPSTQTTVNEIGSILAGDPNIKTPIPDSYWNLSGACYAYVFGHLATLGIEVAGESQLVGYPTQFPSVSMVDWNTGAPNARFRVLQLLKSNFAPGDKIVQTKNPGAYVYALGMVKPRGERKLLLVNKRNRDMQLELGGAAKSVEYVDQTTKGNPPAKQALSGDKLTLRGYSVAVVTMR
ncbi:MAG: glycosyl hydrolase family 39 [Bryobacterales bacterium]|nr:glycosyl hydrolase family 39 [Bryobacterales bacterium]